MCVLHSQPIPSGRATFRVPCRHLSVPGLGSQLCTPGPQGSPPALTPALPLARCTPSRGVCVCVCVCPCPCPSSGPVRPLLPCAVVTALSGRGHEVTWPLLGCVWGVGRKPRGSKRTCGKGTSLSHQATREVTVRLQPSSDRDPRGSCPSMCPLARWLTAGLVCRGPEHPSSSRLSGTAALRKVKHLGPSPQWSQKPRCP